MKKLCFLYFIFLIASSVLAQYRWNNLNIENGLVENAVTNIFADAEGFMWFSTQDGISQYDGVRFHNYVVSRDSQTSLSDNFVWGLTEDNFGNIWACSRNGINRIDKKTKQVTRFYFSKTNRIQITNLTFGNDSMFALIGGEVFCFKTERKYKNRTNYFTNLKSRQIGDNIISIAYEKSKDRLWILSEKEIFSTESKQKIPVNFRKVKSNHFSLPMHIHGDSIWFTNGREIILLNTKKRKVFPLNINVENRSILDFAFYQNHLWVATSNGLAIVQALDKINYIGADNSKANQLASNNITAIASTKKGVLWLGTADQGISLYLPQVEQFKFLSKETFGANASVKQLVQKGNQLFVNADGLEVLTLKNPQLTGNLFLRDNVIGKKKLNFSYKISCLAYGTNLLVGTESNGLFILNQQFNTHKTLLPGQLIYALQVLKNGDIFVASDSGFFVFSKTFDLKIDFNTTNKIKDARYVIRIFEDKKGKVWVGTNNGAFCYHGTALKHYPFNGKNIEDAPAFNFVSGFADFGDGNIWMSTYGGGLSKLNLSNGKFTHFGLEAGLANNVCNAMEQAGASGLWISTNRGISYFNTLTNQFTNYGKSDGLIFTDFFMAASFKNQNNELLFGTPNGMVCFNPEKILQSKEIAKVYINELEINYKAAFDRISNFKLQLYPNDESVTLRFTSLNFSQSAKVKYRYKLAHLQDSWQETNEEFVSFTKLPAGHYKFIVKACNESGIWNSEPTELELVVNPPFYKRTWFIIILGAFLAVIGGLLIKYVAQRKLKIKLTELRLQQEIELEKQRISRDLHDNLGAELTYISGLIDQKVYLIKDPEQKAELELISSSSRHAMQQMRETIWAIQPERITTEKFAEKVKKTNAKYASIQNIELKVKTAGINVELPPSKVIVLFRICQESINNAVKYANASEIRVDIYANNEQFKINISDNGIGFDPTEVKRGYGLNNMQERAEEINAQLQLNSQIRKGTSITVSGFLL